MNIVLLEPEIPQNVGNIGRSCVATNSKLHLIKPFCFSLDDKHLKRAGLDYWQDLDLYIYENYEDFLNKNPNAKIFMATTKAKKIYTEAEYSEDSFILFGKESKGIPEDILKANNDSCIRVPMHMEYRSLNLSNSVAIILYEALRQLDFLDLKYFGEFHNK